MVNGWLILMKKHYKIFIVKWKEKFIMRCLGFESKIEKQLRLELLDLKNELHRKECEEKKLPFFKVKYEDDNR